MDEQVAGGGFQEGADRGGSVRGQEGGSIPTPGRQAGAVCDGL